MPGGTREENTPYNETYSYKLRTLSWHWRNDTVRDCSSLTSSSPSSQVGCGSSLCCSASCTASTAPAGTNNRIILTSRSPHGLLFSLSQNRRYHGRRRPAHAYPKQHGSEGHAGSTLRQKTPDEDPGCGGGGSLHEEPRSEEGRAWSQEAE